MIAVAAAAAARISNVSMCHEASPYYMRAAPAGTYLQAAIARQAQMLFVGSDCE
jgi:hypothetical protein